MQVRVLRGLASSRIETDGGSDRAICCSRGSLDPWSSGRSFFPSPHGVRVFVFVREAAGGMFVGCRTR